MTKEELKQEAEKYAEGMAKYYASTHEDCIPSQFEKYLRNAYIYSAEPREKRIAELEAQVTRAFEVLEGKRKQIADLTEQNTSLLTSVENLNKSVQELEAQIDKMKCCANCQTVRDAEGNCYLKKDGKCKDKDKWELRR